MATQNTSGYPQIATKQGKVYRLGGYIPAIVDTSYGMGSILKGIAGVLSLLYGILLREKARNNSSGAILGKQDSSAGFFSAR